MNKYKINDKDFQTILDINKDGGDRVMFLSGGLPLGSGKGGAFRSTQEKINDFWEKLGEQEGFDWKTIQPINNREFYAEPVAKQKR